MTNTKSAGKWIKLLIGIIIVVVCLSFVFLYSLELRKTSDRGWGDYHLTADLKQLVIEKTRDLDNPESIIEECCDIATDYLSFTVTNDIANHKANCVGYAQLTSALLNHAFRNKNIPYRAKPVVGTVHSFGVNLNEVALCILPSLCHPFFKDHDFVEIGTDDGTVYIDTSLRDLPGRKFVQN
ncbi:MAG: hypothetical protein K2H21_00080 [Muribaculaceae bacterium]|nr:hypothetical protein [Muribaculaceae bacterium]